MKWYKKLTAFAKAVGLMVLTHSCGEDQGGFALLSHKALSLPSASAVEFYNGKLYVLGDDATHLMVLDTELNIVDSLRFLPDTVARMPKGTKPDIESAYLVNVEGKAGLVAVGSQSTPQRERLFAFALEPLQFVEPLPFPNGVAERMKPGELNIEGSCKVGNATVFANRANTTHRTNRLVIWDGDGLSTTAVLLPESGLPLGLSGLYYVPSNDRLLFTASEENTPNAVQDGRIGESYLGWIENYSRKTFESTVEPTGWIPLSKDPAFKGQKVESVCAVKKGDGVWTLYLVSDNDDGNSRIFKCLLRL